MTDNTKRAVREMLETACAKEGHPIAAGTQCACGMRGLDFEGPNDDKIVRFLSEEEQEIMERALRRSVKVVKQGC